MKTVIEMAHRTCWRYKKSTDPHHSDTYTFNDHTLKAFADSIREDAIDKFNRQMNQVCEEARLLDHSGESADMVQESVAIGIEWKPCVKLPIVVHVREQRKGETHVSTREGITPVKPDDLIMRGVAGEEYPIGRELFNKTYTFDIDTTPPTAALAARQMRDAVVSICKHNGHRQDGHDDAYARGYRDGAYDCEHMVAALPVPSCASNASLEVQWRDLTDDEKVMLSDRLNLDRRIVVIDAVIAAFKEKNK